VENTFLSTRHPGGQPAAVLFGQALAGPVGICSLPVMIGALVTMLEGGRPLPFLTIGFPISLAVAWWWTASRLRTEIVELHVDGMHASFRSRWDVAVRRPPGAGSAILDVRSSGVDLLVTIGLETILLRRTEWPDLDLVRSACTAARAEHVDTVRSRLDAPPLRTPLIRRRRRP
jgi:hypothetical protein